MNYENIKDKCDDYCNHSIHPFLYWLNDSEKDQIRRISGDCIYNQGVLKPESLQVLRQSLINFFDRNRNGIYFLKLSALSPKDAYYHLIGGVLEDEELVTTDILNRDLNLLKVGYSIQGSAHNAANHSLNILVHSDRIYCELQYDENDTRMCFLLLDWKQINQAQETRCFIRNRQLVAISQYYIDLTNVYPQSQIIYEKIKTYINKCLDIIPENCAVDIDVSLNGELTIIEYNPYELSDTCLYSSQELSELYEDSQMNTHYQIPFKIKQDDHITTIASL